MSSGVKLLVGKGSKSFELFYKQVIIKDYRECVR